MPLVAEHQLNPLLLTSLSVPVLRLRYPGAGPFGPNDNATPAEQAQNTTGDCHFFRIIVYLSYRFSGSHLS